MQKRTHLLRTRRYVKKRAFILFFHMHFFLLPAFVFFAFFSSLYPLFFLFSLHSFFLSARWTSRKNDRIGKQIHMTYRVWRYIASLRIFAEEYAGKDRSRFASSAIISFVCYPSFERVWVSATETDVDLIRNRNHLFRPLRSSTRDAFIRQGLNKPISTVPFARFDKVDIVEYNE